jgi:YggT family protein
MLDVVVALLNLFALALVLRVVVGWFATKPSSPAAGVYAVLFRLTEPVVAPVRRWVPNPGGFDLSIFLVFIAVRWLLVPVPQGGF